jgi:hypothetical protein
MPLSKSELDELNILLKDKKIDIPDFRRSVGSGGQNGDWIKKKIAIKNPNLPKRVTELVAKI